MIFDDETVTEMKSDVVDSKWNELIDLLKSLERKIDLNDSRQRSLIRDMETR